MIRFPKDCWERGCEHFDVYDLSVDDLVCCCSKYGWRVDACDEDFLFRLCPDAKEDKK